MFKFPFHVDNQSYCEGNKPLMYRLVHHLIFLMMAIPDESNSTYLDKKQTFCSSIYSLCREKINCDSNTS